MPSLKDLLTENLNTLRAKLLMYIHINSPLAYRNGEASKLPVVFIQGINARWSSLKPLIDYIHSQGYPVYTVKALGHNLKSVAESAKLVKEFAKREGLKKFIVVGHSKGGLVGKYILCNLNDDNAMIGLVATSTPFAGSNLAHKAPKPYREFIPESELIQKLQGTTKHDNCVISIFPEYDSIAVHASGSTLEFGLENIKLPIRGHNAMIFKTDSHNAVLSAIEKLSKK